FFCASAVMFASGCGALKRCAYEGFGRDEWQQPHRVIAALCIAPGARVAALGEGGGYFTFRLARAVGPGGHVYAVDIDEQMNAYVAKEAAKQGLANVSTVLATESDAPLPGAGGLGFTRRTYQHPN